MALFSFRKALSFIGLDIKPTQPSFITRAIRNIVQKSLSLAAILNGGDESDDNPNQAVHSPYRQVAWVNIAVTKIASNIPRAPFRLFQDGEEITRGEAYDLITNVNSAMSRYQLWEAIAAWMETRGEAFWLFDPEQVSGVPTDLFIPDPSRMKERTNKKNEVVLWIYDSGNEFIPYLPDQLIHFRLWNPWNRNRGVNPVIALEVDIDQDYLAGISNLNMINNGSVPDGMLWSEQRIDEPEAKRVKERWLQEHRGANKAHGISVLGQGVEYKAIQVTPKEMEYFAMKRWSRDVILSRYGVPAVLATITDQTSSTLSGDDTKEQLGNFWNQTLIPLQDLIEQKLETDFFKRYGLRGVTGKFDRSLIPELQPDIEMAREADRQDVVAGIETINELRERRGLAPVAWGDTAWFPLSLVPAGTTLPSLEEPKHVAVIEETKTPIMFFGETPVTFLQDKAPQYSDLAKDLHWKAVIDTWEAIERGYEEALKAWLFAQRSHILQLLVRGEDVTDDLVLEIVEEAYWKTQTATLIEISRPWFMRAVEATEDHIRLLAGLSRRSAKQRIDFEIDENWTIFDTRAVQLLRDRISKIGKITETVRKGISKAMQDVLSEGLTEGEAAQLIRDKFNIAQNRVKTIARTEIGGVLQDSRIATYEHFGFETHEWLTARDKNVRDEHRIDGEIQKIGDQFSNGMRWPYDNEVSDPGLIINCRCLTVPITEDENV